MRNALLVCCCLLVPFGLTACGGGSEPTDQVPTAPPVAQPLPDADALASGSTGAGAADSTTTTPSDQGTTTDQSSGAVTTTPSSGGAAAPTTPAPATPTTPTTTTAPPSGGTAAPPGVIAPSANAGSTKQFCQDNPGAC